MGVVGDICNSDERESSKKRPLCGCTATALEEVPDCERMLSEPRKRGADSGRLQVSATQAYPPSGSGATPPGLVGRAMLEHRIRGVFAMPVLAAGEYVGALDLFRVEPGPLAGEQLTGAAAAAELAGIPVLDLLAVDLKAAVDDPTSDAWAELCTLSRAEVSQATGMLVAQLDVDPTEALVRLRAHAYATGRSATEVAQDIIDRRLRLEMDR
ncbi:ANTAR domain-containing protein [Mycolicibacterium sarraceniae]|uniref:ANTAR domain-containing protein n=1 Tax=Mycolicibacterium sarraceniae TaxID=1534348 RepID=UPI001F373A60|nr:ANTAR domain-containing protein [Mycolicibacterium sarraceniae]